MLANVIKLVSGCVTFLGGFLVVWGAVSLGLAIREQQGGPQIATAISTLGDKLSQCEVVLEDSADIAHAWAFVTCSYQTSNSRTVVYAKEVETWDSRPSE